MLDTICKKLGVEVGEIWKNEVGDTYKITEGGLFHMWAINEWDSCDGYDYGRLLTGELKPIWKPKEGEYYYIPYFIDEEYNRYEFFTWSNSQTDQWYFENNMAFRTKREAIKATNKLIEIYKEG